jgi:hypothetical protein
MFFFDEILINMYGSLGVNKNPQVPYKHIATLVTKIGRNKLINLLKYCENISCKIKYGSK